MAKVCKSSVTRQPGNQKRQNPKHKQIRQVEDDASGESSDSLGDVLVLKQTGSKLPPLRVSLQLDDCKITMEVDTGASVSIMSEDTYRKIWPKKRLIESSVKLQTYSKEPLPVVGARDVFVQYEGQSATLPLIVVKGNG